MKKIVTILFVFMTLFKANSQNIVYDGTGKKITFKAEDLDIEFSSSTVKSPAKTGAELAPALLAVIPTLVDVGFKLTSKALENNVKKFTAEYSKQKSYLGAGGGTIPNFAIVRKVGLTADNPDKDALRITFRARNLDGISAFIYYVENLNLLYSSAKSTRKDNILDYTFEIKLTLMIEGEKKVQELAPLVISSVKFENKTFEADKHRTEIVLLPKGALCTDVSVKIVETNRAKVRAEKVLSMWNDNKDDVKTIINNFLPKEEKKDGDEKASGGGNDDDGN